MFSNNCFETYKNCKFLINDNTVKLDQIGNADLDDNVTLRASYDYYWMHAMISGRTYRAIQDKCGFNGGFNGTYTKDCQNAMNLASQEKGNVDDYDIYAPTCHDASNPSKSSDSVYNIKHNISQMF